MISQRSKTLLFISEFTRQNQHMKEKTYHKLQREDGKGFHILPNGIPFSFSGSSHFPFLLSLSFNSEKCHIYFLCLESHKGENPRNSTSIVIQWKDSLGPGHGGKAPERSDHTHLE